jgi:ABC-type transport system involved in multi-copper enzyme maturation permease subunit
VRLLRGELRKLIKRPASRITLILMVVIVVLIYVVAATQYKSLSGNTTSPNAEQSRAGIKLLLTFPGAYAAVIGLITQLGGLLAIGFGAAAAGADWNWGMVKVAIARGESRSRYILAKLAAVLLLVGLGVLISWGIGVAAAVGAASVAGIDLSGVSDSSVVGKLPEQLLRGFWGIAEETAIGFAIATFARSQLAGLGAGIALYFVEQFSAGFLPDIVRYFPFHVATTALRLTTNAPGNGAGGSLVPALDPNVSLLLVTVYLVIAAAAAALIVERAEITG